MGMRLLPSLLLLLLAGAVTAPVAFVALNGFTSPDGFTLAHWREAWSQTGIVSAVVNTAWRVLASEVISFPIAILITWLVTRYDLPGKTFVDTLMWIALFLPSVPVILGWILLLDPQFGLINLALREIFGRHAGVLNIYSFWGIVFAHLVTRAVAAKYIFLAPAFRNLSGALEEAAAMCGATRWQIARSIVLPALAPAIAIAAVVSAIFSIESFEIELVLGPPARFFVYSTKIYQLIHENPPQLQVATALSLAVVAAMLPLFWLQRHFAARVGGETLGSGFRRANQELAAWRWPAAVLLIGLASLISLVPLSAIGVGAFMKVFGFFDIKEVFTTDHWRRVFADSLFFRALLNTILLSAAAAAVGTAIAGIAAYVSVRSRTFWRGTIDFVSWLPSAIPGVILGLGILWMFLALVPLRPLYGTLAVLVFAVVLASLTVAVQLMRTNMIQVSEELEEASRMVGASGMQTFLRIIVPLLGPAFATTAILVFGIAARNVSNVALLVTGNNRPLALLQVDYMLEGRYEAASIVGLVLVAISLSVALATKAFAKRVEL